MQNSNAVFSSLDVIDQILQQYQLELGEQQQAYLNHCCRMAQCAIWLSHATAEQQQKIAIAAAFHDLGLWTQQTLDYLPPSEQLAIDYLKQNQRDSWQAEIVFMIRQHHQLRANQYAQYPLVEAFRKADLVDVSMGLCRFGITKQAYQALVKNYPVAGFYAFLMRSGLRWAIRHPMNIAPFMRW